MTVRIIQGDARSLPLADGSVHAIVCDPPYELGFMGKKWDATGVAYDVATWREALRVLKPGGHLLAFGGTRTWHRLACAIEDAGFELRDSIAWMYGSGFPKSRDISKDIDKAAGAERKVVGSKLGLPGYGTRNGIGLNSTMTDDGWYGVGAEHGGLTITAPATAEARRWQGWGTALKPAFEPIVVARKPLGGRIHVKACVEESLRAQGVTGEIRWTTRPARNADSLSLTPSSGSTEPQPMAATFAKTASESATPPTENATARCTGRPAVDGGPTTQSEAEANRGVVTGNSGTRSLMPTAQTAGAAASDGSPSSLSTTSMAEAPRTENPSMARCTPNCDASVSLRGIESFAGIATGLTGSRAHVLIRRMPDGSFLWPEGLPESLDVPSTVAANVLQWGCGALNVDGCRTGAPEDKRAAGTRTYQRFDTGSPGKGLQPAPHDGLGRWPTNVVFSHVGLTDGDGDIIGDACDPACVDGCPVAELDAQSDNGGSGSGKVKVSAGRKTGDGSWNRSDRGMHDPGRENVGVRDFGDSGGPSRFFPTFRYQAKADGWERPVINGVAHPTVKPLGLMRWLVRLVTPAGGTVLDQFAGSGPTVEAALMEGFPVIGVDLDEEGHHIPMIRYRVDRARRRMQPGIARLGRAKPAEQADGQADLFGEGWTA